jgi:hypothetical protein
MSPIPAPPRSYLAGCAMVVLAGLFAEPRVDAPRMQITPQRCLIVPGLTVIAFDLSQCRRRELKFVADVLDCSTGFVKPGSFNVRMDIRSVQSVCCLADRSSAATCGGRGDTSGADDPVSAREFTAQRVEEPRG